MGSLNPQGVISVIFVIGLAVHIKKIKKKYLLKKNTFGYFLLFSQSATHNPSNVGNLLTTFMHPIRRRCIVNCFLVYLTCEANKTHPPHNMVHCSAVMQSNFRENEIEATQTKQKTMFSCLFLLLFFL